MGSNINPEKHIPEALKSVQAFAVVTGISTHFRTLPVNNDHSQNNYLNGVWRMTTELTTPELISGFRKK